MLAVIASMEQKDAISELRREEKQELKCRRGIGKA